MSETLEHSSSVAPEERKEQDHTQRTYEERIQRLKELRTKQLQSAKDEWGENDQAELLMLQNELEEEPKQVLTPEERTELSELRKRQIAGKDWGPKDIARVRALQELEAMEKEGKK